MRSPPPPRPSAHTAVHICKLCKFCTFSYFQLQNISKSNIAQVDTRVYVEQKERKMLMSSYCHLSGQCNYFTWTTRPSAPCTQCTISLSTPCTVCIAHTVTYCALPRIQSNWLGGWVGRSGRESLDLVKYAAAAELLCKHCH